MSRWKVGDEIWWSDCVSTEPHPGVITGEAERGDDGRLIVTVELLDQDPTAPLERHRWGYLEQVKRRK